MRLWLRLQQICSTWNLARHAYCVTGSSRYNPGSIRRTRIEQGSVPMSNQPRRLGRGLSSLINSELTSQNHPAASPPIAISTTQPRHAATLHVARVPIESVRTNPFQPRKTFDEVQLASLARS